MANSSNKPLHYLVTAALLVGSALPGCDEPEEPTHNEPYEEELPTENETAEPEPVDELEPTANETLEDLEVPAEEAPVPAPE